MLIRLLERYGIEIHGRLKTFGAGKIVRIKNKKLVAELVLSGRAELLDNQGRRIDLPEKLGGPPALGQLGPLLNGVIRSELPRYTAGPAIQTLHSEWFNNSSITAFKGNISRKQIQIYGGPSPEFVSCATCQNSEWISRLTQAPNFEDHVCATSEDCKIMCQRQGDDAWTHFHQNFWYALYTNSKANAPRCAMFQPQKGIVFLSRRSCDPHTPTMMRQFAQACQTDIYVLRDEIKKDYDFSYMPCDGLFTPDPKGLTVLMYGHDLWKRAERRQDIIDAIKPDYFWTPFLSSWKTHYRFPSKTKIVFRPVPTGQFFTRPNLDPEKKTCDLMSIGATSNPIYQPRIDLRASLLLLDDRFNVSFRHAGGARRARWFGANKRPDKFYYANAYSELLGTARFVIFGPIAQEPQPVFFKYYECLGSGAIPIMPNAPDLVLLGIKPWEHFIPLDEMDTNDKIADLLDHYADHLPIAERAVKWYKEQANSLLFDGFEDLVQEITGGQYPRRLL